MLSSEEVEELLQYSKLSIKDMKKTAQNIEFDTNFDSDTRIFQLSKDIVKEIENNNWNVNFQFKSTDTGNAILCTKNKNYEIRQAETSNTILAVDKLELDLPEDENFGCKKSVVTSICNKFYELKPRKASPGEIYKILKPSTLYHHLNDENIILVSCEDLKQKSTMSDKELVEILSVLKVYKYNDNMRLLDVDYVFGIIRSILDCCIENELELNYFPQNIIMEILTSLYPKEIIYQTLNYYFKIILTDNEDSYWSVNDSEIMRCFAIKLFKINEKEKKSIELDQFMDKWQSRLPMEIRVTQSNLSGIAVSLHDSTKDIKNNNLIQYIDNYELPDEPESRFSALFSIKSPWRLEEIEPFLIDILPPDQTISELLMKHSRCTNRKGLKLFNKR